MKSNRSTFAGFGYNSLSSANSCDVGSSKKARQNVSALKLDLESYIKDVIYFDDCSSMSGSANLICNCITNQFMKMIIWIWQL